MPPGVQRVPYAHQREAIDFLARAGGAILGDVMGLGKTTSALIAAEAIRRSRAPDAPVLIVGPKSVRGVWRSEVEAVFGRREGAEAAMQFVALAGVDPTDEVQLFWLRRARWIFVHGDVVYAWWSQILLRRPVVTILDEAHLFRNGRTRRGKAAALAVSASHHRFSLTGTPILNRVGELWHLLNLTTGPFEWGSPRDFRCRYAGAVWDGHGYRDTEPTHVDELRTRIESLYLRRTVDEVGLALPSLQRQVIEVELEDADREKYAALLEGHDLRAVMRAVLRGTASRKTLQWLSKLRKIASHAKLATTVAEVQSALSGEESIVVFAWQRETVRKVWFEAREDDGPLAVHITGDDGQSSREQMIADFQVRGGLLAATYDALSVGVTLTRARIILMHDLDWVPANMLQAEARVYRIGQTRPVLSKWVVARGTLDDMLIRAVVRKAEAMQSLGDESGQELAGVLSDDEIDESVARLLRWAREG